MGVHAIHVPTSRQIAINADDAMNTASVIKVPIMILAYRDLDAGLIDFDQRRELTPDDYRGGTGLLQTFTPGLRPTFRDLVGQMIITSDNIATDIVLNRVGRVRLNSLLVQGGYTQTRANKTTADVSRSIFVLANPSFASLTDRQIFELGPRPPGISDEEFQRILERVTTELAFWLGQTTAREMTRLLLELYRGRLVSRTSTQQMLAVLDRQLYESRLPRFIKDRALVGHKTGDFPPFVVDDVGIIQHQGGPTIVSVFVNDNRGTVLLAEETIGRIAEDLVTAWSD